MGYKQVLVNLPWPWVKALDALGEREGESRNELIRVAVRDFLKLNGYFPTIPERRAVAVNGI